MEDAALLSHLSSVTFSDTFRGTCTDDDLEQFVEEFFNEEQLHKELEDDSDLYFIGSINTTAVGYMRMQEGVNDVVFINKHKAIELKRIYVLKQHHSQKIGAALMNFALDFAAQKNYEILWLGVWEHNERAKDFYKKFGFINSGIGHAFPIGSTPQTDIWLYKFLNGIKDLDSGI